MNHPLMAIAIFITFFLISAAFGRKLLSAMGAVAGTDAERFVFASGLGMGAVAYLILAVGLLGILTPAALGVLLAVVGVISAREFVEALKDLVRGARRLSSSCTWIGVFVILAIVLIIAPALILALAPPAGLDWDGLSYHLAVPKIYLSQHKIIYVPFMSHSNFPFLIEMLYTLGLAFGSVGAAKLFHFACYGLSALSVYCIGRSHLNASAGRLGALIFVSVPVIIWEAGSGYADLATALFLTLAVYAVHNWEREKQQSWLMVCGIMCGFALSTKVLAGVPVVAMCLWVLMSAGVRGRGFRSALMVGLIALLVGSPWYIKSWLYTGNPVYPFLYSIFGGKYWSAAAAASYQGAQNVFGMGHGFKQFLLLPWNLTVNGRFFFDAPESTKLFSLLGPAFLAFIPLGLLSRQKRRAVVNICLVCAAYLAAWFLLMQQVRYLIGIAPLLALVAGWGLDSVNKEWRIARPFANGFMGIMVCLSLITAVALAVRPARVVFGAETPESYLSESLDVYDAEAFVNESLPVTAKIVLFDEVRGFYLDREYMWGNPGHHEMTPWASFKTGVDMVRFFRSRGYTHALVNWHLARYSGNDLLHAKMLPDAFDSGAMRSVYAVNGSEVYELVGK